MNDILQEARVLLGPPVRIDVQRQWATWWCPFHPDAERAGRSGEANFGIHTAAGYWKCLRCGAMGPSLAALRERLGRYRPAVLARPVLHRPVAHLAQLGVALAGARQALPSSPGWDYLAARGIRPQTAVQFGLGFGLPHPAVPPEVRNEARRAGLIGRPGRWLWEGGLVYADPPAAPTVLQVRHLRRESKKKYQTWGRLGAPLGAWRLPPEALVIVVVEGLFDAMMVSQELQRRGHDRMGAVFTAGAAPARAILDWFAGAAQRCGFILVPDPDEAGRDWVRRLQAVLQDAGGLVQTLHTPDGLDPAEAVRAGWWPFGEPLAEAAVSARSA